MQEDENSTDDPDVETGGGETAEIGFTQSVIVDSEATQPIEAQEEAPSPTVTGFATPVMVGSVGAPLAQPQPYGQVLMVGPPSGAAKIIGIFIIIRGAIGLFDVFSLFEPLTPSFTILTLFHLAVSVGFIYAGIKVHSYEKWGIQMTWVLLVLWLVGSIASVMMMPDMYAQMVEDGDMTEEEFDLLTGELATGIGIGFVAFCGGICGLFVAVPLMVANNGLDNSSLFSSTKPDNIDGGTLKEYMGENEMAAAGETQEE
jgi:hypothetical protein